MKQPTTLFFCLFLACSNILSAQTDPYKIIDSILLVHATNGSYQEGLSTAEQAAQKTQGNTPAQDSLYGEYLEWSGYFCEMLYLDEQALQYYQKAIAVFEQTLGNNAVRAADAMTRLAALQQLLSNYQIAIDVNEKALGIYQKTLGKNSYEAAHCANELGFTCKSDFQLEKALAYFHQARKACAAYDAKDPLYASILTNIARTYRLNNHTNLAEEYYLLAKNTRATIYGVKDLEYAVSLSDLAALYKENGNYAQAEPLLLESKNICASALGVDNGDYATYVDNLADLYTLMQKYNQAEPLFVEAQKLRAKLYGTRSEIYATSLNNLALMYTEKGAFEKAAPLMVESVQIFKETLGAQHADYATALNNLGNAYLDQQQFDKAEPYLLEAAAIRKVIFGSEHSAYATSLNSLAVLYFDHHQRDKAMAYCLASLDANSPQIDSLLLNTSNWKTFDVLELAGLDYYSEPLAQHLINWFSIIVKGNEATTEDKIALQKTYKILKACMLLTERIRNGFSNETDKLRALRNNNLYVRKNLENALLLGEKKYKKEAFGFAELNKSVLLADALKSSRAKSLINLPDSLVQQELALQKQLLQLKKKQSLAKNSAEKADLNSRFVVLTQEVETFLKLLQKEHPKYHALKYENITAKAEDVQELLGEEALFLEYFIDQNKVFLFAISKNDVELFCFEITARELDQQIRKLRYALSNYAFISKKKSEADLMYGEAGHWFFKNLLAPALTDKSIQELIIVSDGALGHLPFGSFLTSSIAQKGLSYQEMPFLLKDYTISYNYSATLFVEAMQKKQVAGNGKLLACAAAYPSLDSASLYGLRNYEMAKLRGHLKALPAAEDEIVTLSNLFEGTFLTGGETNEAFFKKEAPNYGVIHLAMHGILDSKLPILSSMAFTENLDSLEDNFLQAYEIAPMKLQANLVVLSACETGLGKFEQGEGVLSLARAFMYAGVPSLVVSLWPVNDYSTSIIMKDFYNNLANGLSKSAALRQAKLRYLEQATGLAAHPAFWSPFIQIGHSESILIRQKNRFNYWWLGGGLFLFVLLGLLWKFRKQ